jgi:hypothetical protein
MSRWLLALVLTAAGAPAATARDALTTVDACIARLDAALDVGFARVAERCPDLAPSLAASPWAAWLPPDWNKPGNELSAASLAELRALLTRQSSAAAGVRQLRVERVSAVLAGLAPGDRRSGSWWTRFKQWLREVLARRPPTEDSGWLRRFFGNINMPQAVLRVITWAALAMVTALAAAIVVNELRIAGLLRGWRRRSGAAAHVGSAARAHLTLEQVAQASPAEQPRLLLELIVARLRDQDRLGPARALTLHELERAARLQEADRERLTALTAACERVCFAGREVSAPVLRAALSRGRELLAALEAPAPQPQEAG